MGEAKGCEELSVMIVDGGVEGPPDLIVHDEIWIDGGADIVILIGVVAGN